MKRALGIAATAALVAVAPNLAAQECDYGPNSTSAFAKAPQVVETRSTPRPGHGPAGFRYEFRDALIQRDTRPSTHPIVSCVVVGSAAARAGLRPGDVILSVNGKDPRIRGAFSDRRVGTRWVIRAQRGGEEREISFVIEAPPAANG